MFIAVFSFLVLVALLVAWFVLTAPLAPPGTPICPSLSHLPADHRLRRIYPDDIYGPGAYASLPQGRVRYWLLGPESGEKIVFVAGLSVPSVFWKDVAEQMAARGFRVLMYDLYGRGYSDAPLTTYNTGLFTTQLALLLQHLGWSKVHVAGGSMGGPIAAAFAVHFPHLVAGKVVLVAPTGLIEYSDMPWKMRFGASPLMRRIKSSALYRVYLEHFVPVSSDDMTAIVELQATHLPGYNHAVASTIRDGPIHSLVSTFAALGHQSVEVLAVWGTADDIMPYGLAQRLQALVPQTELVTLEGGDHDLPLTHPDEVAAALDDWFAKRSK